MDTGINIVNHTPDSLSMRAMTDYIERVFKAGHVYRIDQDTIKLALTQLGRAGSASNIITGSSVSG